MAQRLNQPDFEPIYFEIEEFSDNRASPIFHGFFGRQGGVSLDIYAGLNCGPGSGDQPDRVKANRKIVSDMIGCAAENLLSLYQVHGDECLQVKEPWSALDERPQADAMVTEVPGLALSILTADCAPVLFYGEKKNGAPVVGAAHAGWGGALKGVLGAAVKQMKALGATAQSLRAAIGPCIGQESYEVTEEFAAPFLKEDEENERFFMAARQSGHLMFDLPGYCAMKLAREGLKRVYIKDLDTYFNEEDFFSYRRTTHRQEKDYGRQISVIMIKP